MTAPERALGAAAQQQFADAQIVRRRRRQRGLSTLQRQRETPQDDGRAARFVDEIDCPRGERGFLEHRLAVRSQKQHRLTKTRPPQFGQQVKSVDPRHVPIEDARIGRRRPPQRRERAVWVRVADGIKPRGAQIVGQQPQKYRNRRPQVRPAPSRRQGAQPQIAWSSRSCRRQPCSPPGLASLSLTRSSSAVRPPWLTSVNTKTSNWHPPAYRSTLALPGRYPCHRLPGEGGGGGVGVAKVGRGRRGGGGGRRRGGGGGGQRA